MSLLKIQDRVEKILEDYPETRDSDMILYLKMCEQTNEIALSMPFSTVIRQRKALGLPNIESVGRARRKLQANNPRLRASAIVEEERYQRWKEYRDYAVE